MSSVIYKPFGNNRPFKSRRSIGTRTVFHLKVEGGQVEDFVEFLELVYQSHIQVKQQHGTHLFFTSESHRTSAGIRFALILYGVTLLSIQEW